MNDTNDRPQPVRPWPFPSAPIHRVKVQMATLSYPRGSEGQEVTENVDNPSEGRA